MEREDSIQDLENRLAAHPADPIVTRDARKIESGDLNAYSWAGPVNRQRYLTLVKHPIAASGTTEKADAGPYPAHDHAVDLRFDDAAKVVPCQTATSHGHSHMIHGTTRTEPTDGHSHGLQIRS